MNANNRLRKLLDVYYSGDATPEQTAEIARLFSETDPLPADLAAEKEIFESIADLQNLPIEEPENLDIIYADAIDRAIGSTQKSSARILWLRISGIAAAIAIIAATAIVMLNGRDALSSGYNDLTAATDTTTNTPPDKQIAPISEAIAETPSTVENVASAKPSPAPVHKTTVHKPAEANPSNTRVITDPEEAGKYTEMVFSLLADNLSRGIKESRKADDAIRDINQKINNTLNDITR